MKSAGIAQRESIGVSRTAPSRRSQVSNPAPRSIPSTVQGACAGARLSLLEDVLFTAGWTKNATGWVPPERYRRAIEISNGRGEWSLPHAIGFMAFADEATIKAVEARPGTAR